MDSAPITEQQLPPPEEKIQTPQEKHENEDQIKAAQASRRSRKDIQGRDFICGCGKKYLSYPALYTHIKTKHQGKQPQGTMKYSTTAPIKKSKTKLEEEHLNYLSSQVKRQDLKLMDLLAPRFVGSTPLSARLKSKILEKPLIDTYHNLLKTTGGQLKLTKQSSLQQHLVAWLIGAGQHITQKLHDQYQWFARTVNQCYYQMGGQVYNKCFSKKDGGLCYIPNFKVEKVKYFPLICDFYIRFFLVYEYTQLNANLMELILTDFCNWLNSRKCTFIQIILNKEYKLTVPLNIEEDVKNEKEKGAGDQDEDKCDLSELIDPSSQKQNDFNDHKAQSNPENREENGVEQELLNEKMDNQKELMIVEQHHQIEQGEQMLKQNLQNPGQELKNSVDRMGQNGLANWSLQQGLSSVSSEQIILQEAVAQHNNQKVQSEAPQENNQAIQNKENNDVQSEKL